MLPATWDVVQAIAEARKCLNALKYDNATDVMQDCYRLVGESRALVEQLPETSPIGLNLRSRQARLERDLDEYCEREDI